MASYDIIHDMDVEEFLERSSGESFRVLAAGHTTVKNRMKAHSANYDAISGKVLIDFTVEDHDVPWGNENLNREIDIVDHIRYKHRMYKNNPLMTVSGVERRTSNTLMMTPEQSYFIKPSAPPERYGKSPFDYFNKVQKCMAESLGWKKWGSGAIMEPKPKSPLDELRSEVDEWLKDALT